MLLSLGSKNKMCFYFVLRSLIRNFALVSRRLHSYGCGWAGGQDIYKGVYYALVLTVRNRMKIYFC